MSTELHLVIIPLCFIAVAFFEGVETGMLGVSHVRLMHLIRTGSKAAKILNEYLSDMQRFLATTLIGTNLMSVILSTLSTELAQKWFPGLHLVQTVWATAMAFMILFFCQYLPKLFFTTRPLRRTLTVAPVFYVIEQLLTPVTRLVLFMTKWLAPKNRSATDQRFLMTREYIQNVVSDPKDGSRITAVERLMINRVLALQSQTAAQVMTSLARVSRATEAAPLSSCYRLVRDSGHVRLPVFSEDGTRCVGVLNTLEVLAADPDPDKTRACDCMQTPFFVNADMRADDVLPLMRKYRQPMALVRALGGNAVLGIITEENILFALTGNLQTA
ncbi:MAG: CNNM domain-containing protein [bacterium]